MTANRKPLCREFYGQTVRRVARELLGKRLVSLVDDQLTSGWIVETEAYLPHGDSACHAAGGRTPRNDAMFGPPGHAYVYAIHAKWCFNTVAEPPEKGAAVLIRSIQPIDGVHVMLVRRESDRPKDICRGPARLCQAMGINKAHNYLDLTVGKTIWIDQLHEFALGRRDIRITRRIGVTSAKNLKLRYLVRGNRYVSGPQQLGY